MATFDVWLPLQSGRCALEPLTSAVDPKETLATRAARWSGVHPETQKLDIIAPDPECLPKDTNGPLPRRLAVARGG